MQHKNIASSAAILLVGATFLLACGGSSPPAESPEAAPEPPPAEAPASPPTPAGDAPAEGEHTMPDGTKMPDGAHGEGK